MFSQVIAAGSRQIFRSVRVGAPVKNRKKSKFQKFSLVSRALWQNYCHCYCYNDKQSI